MRSEVQVLLSPPSWGISSAGRAPALHAGGQRFDPAILHHRDRIYFAEYTFLIYRASLSFQIRLARAKSKARVEAVRSREKSERRESLI